MKDCEDRRGGLRKQGLITHYFEGPKEAGKQGARERDDGAERLGGVEGRGPKRSSNTQTRSVKAGSPPSKCNSGS